MTPRQLKNFRKRLGMSQNKLADTLGVPIGTLRNWEQGRLPVLYPGAIRLALERLAQPAQPQQRQ